MSVSAVPPLGDSDHGWTEIEQFIAEIAELSQSDISFAEFARESLDRAISVLSAAGGAIWVRGGEAELHLQCQQRLDLLGSQTDSPTTSSHARFLERLIREGKADVVPPGSSTIGGVEVLNDSNYLWIGSPFRLDGTVAGAIVVIQPSGLSEAAQQGNLKLLAMVCDLTGDFLRRQQLRELRGAEHRWQQYESLVLRALGSLDLGETAYQLANDGRTLIGCDRVTLIVPHYGRWRVAAISGVDTFDRRSPVLQSLEELARVVLVSGQSLSYRGRCEQLPPQIETPLSAYLDASHAHQLDLLPLEIEAGTGSVEDLGRVDSSEAVGVLVVENFGSDGGVYSEEGVARVGRLAAIAVRNAVDYDTLPFLSLARFVRRSRRLGRLQKNKLILAAVFVLLLAVGLVWIPAPFYVKLEGELQPDVRRDVFAPADGEVVEVMARHDDDVEAGDELLVLRSRPLEVELQRLQGEYQTTEKRLLAIASARVQTDGDPAADRYPGQLAAEEQELEQQLLSQRKQIELIRGQRDRLTVRSPIRGRVLTWNPDELLTDRPVQRGQLLMSTADVDGPWVLEMSVRDDRIGYVLEAQRISDEPLSVVFSLATDRRNSYHGRIKQIGGRTEVVDGKTAAVRVTATVPQTPEQVLRPGATVYAKIDCGSRSIGFVWFHDLLIAVRTWVWF